LGSLYIKTTKKEKTIFTDHFIEWMVRDIRDFVGSVIWWVHRRSYYGVHYFLRRRRRNIFKRLSRWSEQDWMV